MQLYVHPAVVRKRVRHGDGMVAEADMVKGEIVSIDRMFVGNADKAILLEHIDPDFIASLYPREGTTVEKVSKNAFGKTRDELYLGHTVSHYNHACKPNAVRIVLHVKNWSYCCVIAAQDILSGSEMTISYGEGYGHEILSQQHDIHCDCLLTCEQRKEHLAKAFEFAQYIVFRSQFITSVIETDISNGELLDFYKILNR